MSDVNYLSSFFKLFRLFGLLLFDVDNYRARLKFFALYSIYILLNIALIAISLIYFDNVISSELPSGILSEYVQVLSPIIAHTVIIVETICKFRRNDEKILRKFIKLETMLTKFGDNSENNRNFINTSFWMFIVINFIGLMSDIVALTDIRTIPNWCHSQAIRMFAYLITRNFLLLYLFMLNFIKYKVMFSTDHLVVMRDEVVNIRSVRHMHKIYIKLWKLLLVINHRFGWSLSVIILYYFICSLIGIYWLSYRMRYGLLDHDAFDSFLVAEPLVVSLICLYYNGQSLKNSLTKLRCNLHRLIRPNFTAAYHLSQGHSEHIYRAVNKLSLLILAMDFNFGATGALSFVNFHMVITSIASAVFLMLSFTDYEFQKVKTPDFAPWIK